MELNLSGKVVIVTGGAKGIGRAVTKEFLKENACVCMVGTDQNALQNTEKGFIQEFADSSKIMWSKCDVTNAVDIQQCIRDVLQKFGHLDILVNNAGLLKAAKILDMSEEQWDKGMDVNLKSVFLFTKEAAKTMPEGGVIINASSFAAQIPTVGQSVYAAAKSGVKSFTRVSAAELAPLGIRVFAYIPGVIVTQLTQPQRSDPVNADRMKNDIAMHRFGEPEEVASAIVFLSSEKAGYISGTSIEITGGKFCVQNPGKAYDDYKC